MQKLSDEDFLKAVKIKDTNGKTVLHYKGNSKALERFFDIAPTKDIAEIYLKPDSEWWEEYLKWDDRKMYDESKKPERKCVFKY